MCCWKDGVFFERYAEEKSYFRWSWTCITTVLKAEWCVHKALPVYLTMNFARLCPRPYPLPRRTWQTNQRHQRSKKRAVPPEGPWALSLEAGLCQEAPPAKQVAPAVVAARAAAKAGREVSFKIAKMKQRIFNASSRDEVDRLGVELEQRRAELTHRRPGRGTPAMVKEAAPAMVEEAELCQVCEVKKSDVAIS
jgi:hypothetical protein